MATAKKCIITGRNQINGVFYMLNEGTTGPDTVWYTGGKEKKVRKECKRKIFDSKADAKLFVRHLNNEPNAYDTKWFIETV